ncbi:MAG: hypothetical protein WDN08_12155 [Rhizomicrobium sp.]
MVAPLELTHHIAATVRIAGARRIGHGYDIPYETDAAGLLAEMARRRIAVEINLTSNAITPGIVGPAHPLALYRAAGVPVTLSADDEGVFRIDLTHEYVRAVVEQKLGYRDLKEIARNGLEYSFVAGQSLWQGRRLSQTRRALRRRRAWRGAAAAGLRRVPGRQREGGAAMGVRGTDRRL